MFRCQMCDTVVPAGTRANKVVVASRPRTYASRGGGERGGFRGRFREPRPEFDKGGTGREIVRELSVCGNCAKQHADEVAEQTAAETEVTEAVAEPSES